mgnify:FL=1
MFNEKFNEVLTKEGVVSITSWSAENVHVVNTWNSYLVKSGENKLLIPAAGMRKTQKNVEANSRVILTLGSKEVLGYKDYQGTGFVIEGTAKYLTSGEEFDMMKDKFPFLSRVLEISVENLKQTI